MLLLLGGELLVVTARAAQVGSGGPPLVDDDNSLVGSARCAPAVFAMLLHVLLLVMHAVCLVLGADGRDLDLFLSRCLGLELPHQHGLVVRHVDRSNRIVDTVEPLDGAHHHSVVIQIGRHVGLINMFKLI